MTNPQVVSTLSIVFMAVTAFLSIIVPIGIVVFLGVKKKMNWKAMLIGMLLFFLFAILLETLMHRAVLGTDPTQSAIYKNPVLYILYGALAAGVFEEVARFVGFKFLIRVKENESIHTGISYGLGHGGIEAILIGGLSAIGNLMLALAINSGATGAMTAAMTGEQLETFNTAINTIATLPSHLFFLPGIERVAALVIQISLSLFVLKSVSEKKWRYLGMAILLHAAVDIVAVMFQRGYITDIFVMEGIIIAMAAILAVTVFRIYQKKPLQ